MTLKSKHTGLLKIGEQLSKLRKSKGLTQVALGKMINVNAKLISDFELNKRRLHHELVIKYATALDVSTDEILGINTEEKQENLTSQKLHQRLKKIESLPDTEQKFIISVLDRLLASGKE